MNRRSMKIIKIKIKMIIKVKMAIIKIKMMISVSFL